MPPWWLWEPDEPFSVPSQRIKGQFPNLNRWGWDHVCCYAPLCEFHKCIFWWWNMVVFWAFSCLGPAQTSLGKSCQRITRQGDLRKQGYQECRAWPKYKYMGQPFAALRVFCCSFSLCQLYLGELQWLIVMVHHEMVTHLATGMGFQCRYLWNKLPLMGSGIQLRQRNISLSTRSIRRTIFKCFSQYQRVVTTVSSAT